MLDMGIEEEDGCEVVDDDKDTCTWVNHNRYATCKYDCKHPSDCAALEDGSDYTDHMMETQDWDLLLQMVIALHLFHVVFLPCY